MRYSIIYIFLIFIFCYSIDANGYNWENENGEIETIYLPVWPHPQSFVPEDPNSSIILDHNFKFDTSSISYNQKLISDATNRILPNIQIGSRGLSPYLYSLYDRIPSFSSQPGLLRTLHIDIVKDEDEGPELSLGVDESYTLDINQPRSVLTANTCWGVLRGLETFSQLIHWDGENHIIASAPLVIHDWPRFQYRGLLIDTARHYYPISELEQHIEIMAWNKMNVFHWHITDSTSFPFASILYPELAQNGSYDSTKAIYTKQQIQDLVLFAKNRGIMIIPELDVPGHTGSWVFGKPEIVIDCKDLDPFWWTLDPTNELTYQVIDGLIGELMEWFDTPPLLHIGGDEVDTSCWNSAPHIQEYMNSHNLTDYAALLSMFTSRVMNILEDHEARPMVWDEAFVEGRGLTKGTVVQNWRGKSIALSAARAGHDVVLSTSLYLDVAYSGTYALQQMWELFYKVGFEGPGWDDDSISHILGGEAASWSEGADAGNALSRIWQKGPAISERLWSSKLLTDKTAAQRRLANFHCILKRRGKQVGSIIPDYCEHKYSSPIQEARKFRKWTIVLAALVIVLTITNITAFILCTKLQTKITAMQSPQKSAFGFGRQISGYRPLND